MHFFYTNYFKCCFIRQFSIIRLALGLVLPIILLLISLGFPPFLIAAFPDVL
jgi:hypothetical protein